MTLSSLASGSTLCEFECGATTTQGGADCTSWAVFAIDRCGALATGYSAGIRDEDITTPFGRHLADIASGMVTERDDVTVRDLYKGTASGAENDTH